MNNVKVTIEQPLEAGRVPKCMEGEAVIGAVHFGEGAQVFITGRCSEIDKLMMLCAICEGIGEDSEIPSQLIEKMLMEAVKKGKAKRNLDENPIEKLLGSLFDARAGR